MKKICLLLCTSALVAVGCSKSSTPSLTDNKNKVSYSIGLDIGKNMKQRSIEVNPDAVAAGIRDALAGNKPQLSDKEIQDTMMAFQQEMIQKQQATAQAEGEKNKAAGEKYLADNAKKPGVKVLPSGVQYREITAGKGKTPKATNTVQVNYRGTLVDGTEFDSSYKRGQPAEFPANGVIPGWTEVLQLMKEGAKWEVAIPASLAYGERGAGREIGPNSVLVFEIELLAVK